MNLDDFDVRSEVPGDEDRIDAVICRAFGRMDEANLVRLLRRYYPEYDHRYSITVWLGDEMVAHTLFVPARIRLMGQSVSALAVAPVSVMPEWQGNGLGGLMLRTGHSLGKGEGFSVSFLHGHPEYYPRHGYVSCFGTAKIAIDTEKLPQPTQRLHPMPVRPADIPWLIERFNVEWNDVDFAWQRSANLCEWSMPGTNALIWWTEYGLRAAYTLGWAGGRNYSMVLAEDPMLARAVLAILKPRSLVHHPSGWFAHHVLQPEWGKMHANLEPQAMAHEIKLGALQPYLKAIEGKDRVPGLCTWPLSFMMC